MKIDENTKQFWNGEVVRANLIWPNEMVIRFVKKNYKPGADTRILDFGCGAGRNSLALAKDGYNVVALDYGADAIKLLNQKIEPGMNVETILSNGDDIPVQAQSIDGIVACGSLFYFDTEDTIELLRRLKNVLKEGGRIWADWRGTKDSLYGLGYNAGDNCYIMNDKSGREGCKYHFFDEDELRDIYSKAGLKIDSLEEFTYTTDNGSNRCFWYHVIAERQGADNE